MRTLETVFENHVVLEQKSGGDKAYKAFLAKKLDEKGYKSIADIPDDKKDDFFNEIEREWESDEEREAKQKAKDND